ncbi:MAG: hypothetical protein V8Q54_11810 [Alistipes senegalensis]
MLGAGADRDGPRDSFFFVHGSGWRRLIHGLESRGAWRTAGRWARGTGGISGKAAFSDVEVVVPLPLHPLRRNVGGGYDPVGVPRRGMASQLGVGVDRRSVRRRRNTPAKPSDPAATGPATSKAPLRSGIPSGSPGGMSCWSMT